MVEVTTEAYGIFQADVIVRSMILTAILDLRSQPWLLDFVFASLPKDELTASFIGVKEVESAKKWFQRTQIDVLFRRPPDGYVGKAAVTLHLQSSREIKSSLGDVHHHPRDEATSDWPMLTTSFAASYERSTGILVVPSSVTDELVVVPGMYVVDRAGTNHVILTVSDTALTIEANSTADFSQCFVRAAPPSLLVGMESSLFNESYLVGCHVVGDDHQPVLWLHSIITFCFLRYRERLLEARGFENSTISSGELGEERESSPEFNFSRYLTVAGDVRQTWPKDVSEKATSIAMGLRVSDSGKVPGGPAGLIWVGNEDLMSF